MKPILWGTVATISLIAGGFSAAAAQPEKSPNPDSSPKPGNQREQLIDIGTKLDMLISQLQKVEKDTAPDAKPCVKESDLRQQLEKAMQREKEAQKAASLAKAKQAEVEKKLKNSQKVQSSMVKALEDVFGDIEQRKVKGPSSAMPLKTGPLSRATYFVTKDKAEVLIWLLKDVKAPLETKYVQDTLIVTTTPEVHRIIGQFITLIATPQE